MIERPNLGQNIRNLREQKSISQRSLAKQFNVSYQLIQKWERNECEPNLQCLLGLAEIFDVTLEELLKGGEK